MMRTWTNLAWPDDPYRTGQQLYSRPVPRLAAFTTWSALSGSHARPMTAAIVYLPLHRTRPVIVTGQTLAFGFRAASTGDPVEVCGVAAVADLDLMQARRHAAILTGYDLFEELSALQEASATTTCRGLSAVASDWGSRGPAAGRAALFDCSLDLPGGLPLGQACRQAGISPMRAGPGWSGDWHPVTLAVERALAIALLCARHHGRYEWTGTLETAAVMASCAWDCLPWPQAGATASEETLVAADGQRQ